MRKKKKSKAQRWFEEALDSLGNVLKAMKETASDAWSSIDLGGSDSEHHGGWGSHGDSGGDGGGSDG